MPSDRPDPSDFLAMAQRMLRELFGDTLFCGGPGATGRSYSDHPTIVRSIRDRLLTLHGDTVVKTGHGDDTTIAAEMGNVH